MVISQIKSLYRDENDLLRTVIKRRKICPTQPCYISYLSVKTVGSDIVSHQQSAHHGEISQRREGAGHSAGEEGRTDVEVAGAGFDGSVESGHRGERQAVCAEDHQKSAVGVGTESFRYD